MTRSIFATSLFAISAIIAAPQAMADNIANCEIVLMETIEDESGNGSAQIASYRPAADFIAHVYNSEDKVISDVDGLKIRAVLCRRSNVILSETDFKLLATGVPFILSQNFDSAKSNLLTYFFKDGTFQYTHKGTDLPEKQLATLTTRMKDFNSRTDVIETLEAARKARDEKAAAEAIENEKASDDETPLDSENEISGDTKSIEIVEIEPDAPEPIEDNLETETPAQIEPEAEPEPESEPESEIEIVELDTMVEETSPQSSKTDEDITKKDITKKDDD